MLDLRIVILIVDVCQKWLLLVRSCLRPTLWPTLHEPERRNRQRGFPNYIQRKMLDDKCEMTEVMADLHCHCIPDVAPYLERKVGVELGGFLSGRNMEKRMKFVWNMTGSKNAWNLQIIRVCLAIDTGPNTPVHYQKMNVSKPRQNH